jgi:hypothetical protein
MALIIRIDVDRPYGRYPLARHILSRVSSDCYFPRVKLFGFLDELGTMLQWLNNAGARAHIFFRRCTLPSKEILNMLDAGGHEVGLHLENSRSLESFLAEKRIVERHASRRVSAVSKHGSGGAKYGLHHYAPYEPDKYTEWAKLSGMRLFLGNQEDPTVPSIDAGQGLTVFPAAFWLEPHWRDSIKFTVEWLLNAAQQRDIVVLVHPENILAEPNLITDFKRIIETVPSRIVQ